MGIIGNLEWDSSKPNGTPRKLQDTRRLNNLDWKPRISLETGLASSYQWFLQQEGQLRER